MTGEKRLLVGLADILHIRSRCKKCGAVFSIPLNNWQRFPHVCGNCGVEWLKIPSMEEKTLERFSQVLEDLRKIDKDRFTIQFELDSPHE